jgi:nitrogen fixation/metabolism regulation signal transduction histidine kinase
MAGEERNNMMNIYTNSYLSIGLLGLLWAVAYGVALWLA